MWLSARCVAHARQVLVRFQRWRFIEAAPDQRHRLVVALALVIRLGEEIAQSWVGALRKRLDAALRPIQRRIIPARCLADFCNLEEGVRRRQVTLLDCDQRVDISRLSRQRFHNARYAEPFAEAATIVIAGL